MKQFKDFNREERREFFTARLKRNTELVNQINSAMKTGQFPVTQLDSKTHPGRVYPMTQATQKPKRSLYLAMVIRQILASHRK